MCHWSSIQLIIVLFFTSVFCGFGKKVLVLAMSSHTRQRERKRKRENQRAISYCRCEWLRQPKRATIPKLTDFDVHYTASAVTILRLLSMNAVAYHRMVESGQINAATHTPTIDRWNVVGNFVALAFYCCCSSDSRYIYIYFHVFFFLRNAHEKTNSGNAEKDI